MSDQPTGPTEELTTEQKIHNLKVLLDEALRKYGEAKDIATELDNANLLHFDIDDLDDVITEAENLCNIAEGIDDEDEDGDDTE